MTLTEEIRPQLMRRIALDSDSLDIKCFILARIRLKKDKSLVSKGVVLRSIWAQYMKVEIPEVRANRPLLPRVYPIHKQRVGLR